MKSKSTSKVKSVFDGLKKYGVDVTLKELDLTGDCDMKSFLKLSKIPWFYDFKEETLKEIWNISPVDVYRAKDQKVYLYNAAKKLLSRLYYYNCKNNYFLHKVNHAMQIIETERKNLAKDGNLYYRIKIYESEHLKIKK